MTRRQLLSLPAAALLANPIHSQRDTAAGKSGGFPGVAYRNYPRCLPDYLRDLAAESYRMRNSAVARLTTPEAIRTRQRWARETFWKLAGGQPERTPLDARQTGSFERSGYRVEKIVYQSRPNFHIPANLYIPTQAAPPFPAVLFQMGHSNNGKAYEPYQRCCQALVRLGYVVLAFDPMGQGERVYYPGSTGIHSRLESADDEHTKPGKQMLLLGDTSTRLQAWDAIRSLDYLASLPMVDTKRIGATGQSGGATLSMMLMATDDRLAAVVEFSGNSENVACADFNPPGSTDDAEQDFIGSGPVGFDRWDLMYPFAPKPLLISVSDKDFFGTYSPQYISNGWEEFQKLKKVYEVLGHGDRIQWVDTPLPHSLEYDSRLKAYNWFERWLKGGTSEIKEEPPVTPEAEKTLWVSESGNVVRSFGGLTPFALNKARVVQKQPRNLSTLLGITLPGKETEFTILRRVPAREVDIEALEVQSAPKVWAPAWLMLPRGSRREQPVLLALDSSGRSNRWHEGELYQSLAVRGIPVCSADVRGIGDLSPEFGRGDPRSQRQHQSEEDYSWSSLILGKPLVGQRVADILALAAGLRRHPALGGRPVVVAARGKLTVPALFAAALDRKISALYLAGGLVSFRDVVDTEDYDHSFANFVPNLLLHTDLPEVLAALAPRKIVLGGVVDASGHEISAADARRIYSAADAAGILTIRDKGEWDIDSLSSWPI